MSDDEWEMPPADAAGCGIANDLCHGAHEMKLDQSGGRSVPAMAFSKVVDEAVEGTYRDATEE